MTGSGKFESCVLLLGRETSRSLSLSLSLHSSFDENRKASRIQRIKMVIDSHPIWFIVLINIYEF